MTWRNLVDIQEISLSPVVGYRRHKKHSTWRQNPDIFFCSKITRWNEDQDISVPPRGSLPQVYKEHHSLRHQLEYPDIKEKHARIKKSILHGHNHNYHLGIHGYIYIH